MSMIGTGITTGMVLAAGLGTRLRPITDSTPKPLVTVNGKTLLDRALDHLVLAGVELAVVNLHYKAAMIESHLTRRAKPSILFSPEEQLLDTGGGIAKALPHLGDPFFVINSDAVWVDGRVPALSRLARAWQPDRHDALLLVQPTVTAIGHDGPGDFFLDQWGIPRRRREREIVPFLYAGVQILSHRLFAGEADGKFSANRLWDKAIERGRIACVIHDGDWFDVGNPAGLAATEAELAWPSLRR
jgi:MurNAc alpha-1-phosphate uridylyltransferase